MALRRGRTVGLLALLDYGAPVGHLYVPGAVDVIRQATWNVPARNYGARARRSTWRNGWCHGEAAIAGVCADLL